MQIRKVHVLFWLGAALLLFAGASSAAGKVGFINLQRLVSESKIGKEARQDIQKMRKAKEGELSRRLEDLNKEKDELDQKWDELDPRDRRDRRAELKRSFEDYQKMVSDAKEDILREDREVVAIILKKADGVLKTVAKKQGYTIILKDPNAIGYLDPEVDITDEVLKALNK
ncbi:MAG: OmpH family outer membrane protein [Desulfobacterales bacterium]|nr:OmpH family outer membrane protein [Desulfobacterales bacterium]